MATQTLGFIGLGTMGGPMAGHLVRAGHTVQAFNRTPARATAWQARFPDGHTVKSVAAFPQMKPGSILVDHSTTSAAVARELAAEAAQHGLHFVDAPVSGGQAGAENGQLAIMAGGDPAVFAAIEPTLAAYAKRAKLIGPVGAGQLTKMVNQICFTGVVAGLAEGLHFGEKAGLDARRGIAGRSAILADG